MKTKLEVLFSPAEFEALRARDLSATSCVVFDVLRATSSMITALANGAESILPVVEIEEALQVRNADPAVILAGERNGVRIDASLTGSISFDLGNSPREFTTAVVRGKRLVMTTTNGTRALRACAQARRSIVGSFLNLGATSECILEQPAELLIICSGTFDEAAYEDALAAGALCELVWRVFKQGEVADSALMVRKLYLEARSDLPAALREARNAKRLLCQPQLEGDVSFCAQIDRFPFLAELHSDGRVRRGVP